MDVQPSASANADGWSRLHHGIDPRGNRLLWWWLQAMWRLAAPLARAGLPPTAATVAGALLGIAAALERSPWVAIVLVLGAAACDGLDGAVAVLGDAATRFGAIADKVADRIADVAFVIVIWRCGAPIVLAWFTAAGVVAVEAGRELIGQAARVTITVAERPSRVICAVLACVLRPVSGERWPAAVCATVLLLLSVVAVAQLWTLRTRAPAS